MTYRSGITSTIPLQDAAKRHELIESRRVYNMRHCEMNVFETAQQAFSVPLSFNDLVISSMLRGKKIMHMPDIDAFDYLPGETVIFSPKQQLFIDFPEACETDPAQCVALAVSPEQINRTLQVLNENYQNPDGNKQWNVHYNSYHFQNDEAVASLISKIISISTGNDSAKDIYVDLNLQELLIRLIQSENLAVTAKEAKHNSNQSRLHFAIAHIHNNLGQKISIENLCRKALMNRNDFFKLFREQFGISPVEYITRERIKEAKQRITAGEGNIFEISLELGFADPSYFTRVFKKVEGLTPREFATRQRY